MSEADLLFRTQTAEQVDYVQVEDQVFLDSTKRSSICLFVRLFIDPSIAIYQPTRSDCFCDPVVLESIYDIKLTAVQL